MDNGDWKTFPFAANGLAISHFMFADNLFLFGEASVEQMEVMPECLDAFCNSSSELVSKDKTHMFFLKNVPVRITRVVSPRARFQQTFNFGKYLGMLLLHKRVTKQTYSSIVTRVQNQLAA